MTIESNTTGTTDATDTPVGSSKGAKQAAKAARKVIPTTGWKIGHTSMVTTPSGKREAFKVSIQCPVTMTKAAAMASAKENGVSGKGKETFTIDQLADDVRLSFKLDGELASNLVATMGPAV